MNPIEMIPLATGRQDLVDIWEDGCRSMQSEQDAWIAKLRAEGVKASHPDDGWVNREENIAQLVYPHFNDGVEVGDKIALGQPWGDHRIVTVERITMSRFFRDLILFHFR